MNISILEVKQDNNSVTFSRKDFLKLLEKILLKDPENLEVAILYVAIRDGKSIQDVIKEIQEETDHLLESQKMKERLTLAIKSKHWITEEDVKKVKIFIVN